MGCDDYRVPLRKGVLLKVAAFEPHVVQSPFFGASAGLVDRGARPVDPDNPAGRMLHRIEHGQDADTAADIENRLVRVEHRRDSRPDLEVILVALAIECGDERRVSRQIVKGPVGGAAALPSGFNGTVERVEVVPTERALLPGEVVAVGGETAEAPGLEVLLQRRAYLVSRVARHGVLFARRASRVTPHGRFSMMASSYARGTGCGCRSCPLPNTTYFSQVSWLRPIGPRA